MLISVGVVSETISANNPPARCAGYGDLQSISLTVWEAGLGSWTVNTRQTKPQFDTPDWAVVGNLPDSRPGLAAFVADQNNGDCAAEDKSGVLTLDSPSIVIPGGAEVPRISINHWFDTEFGWDGGNLKISVNGGGFNLIPVSAIEYGAYGDVLFPPVEDGFPYNTNPLADELAFTGTYDGQPTGSWIETHINLLGIANPGDTIKLRFDFGIDQCGGTVGWYVDEVEFYSCEAELPPSNCGNRVIDPGEQCDDGNDFIDDGCSNTCQIEEGWQCTAPNLPTVIPDHSFEAGTPNPFWTEFSTNPIGTPICQASICGVGGGTGPSDGLFWAWFGGTRQLHESSLSQSLVIPSTEIELTFELEIPVCDSASDYVEILVDGNQEMLINGSNPLCGTDGYTTQSMDISAYADGGVHNIEFHSETFAVNGRVSSFFIDKLALPGTASVCELDSGYIFNNGFE
jgi:cysteine-rich repeat protein